MKYRAITIIIAGTGAALGICGFAVRSTITHDNVNKPIGGAMMFFGMLFFAVAMYRVLKHKP